MTLEELQLSCRRIYIEDLRLLARLGIYPHEIAAAQEILISASVWVDKTSHEVLQLQYAFPAPAQPGKSGGTDVITVTLWDETDPFEVPEAAEISDSQVIS
jgi:hypothetical protein